MKSNPITYTRRRSLALLLICALFIGILPAGRTPVIKAANTASAKETSASVANAARSSHGLNSPSTTSDGIVTWDCVYFGNYPQSDSRGETKDPIKWRVLSVDGDDAFLLANTNLDAQMYNNTDTEVTWETCTMRSWLNGYGADANTCGVDYSDNNFLDNAFTESEQEAIKDTTVVNEDNSLFRTKGGETTVDKVYLLSISEVMNPSYGFTSKSTSSKTRATVNTEYVKMGGEIKSALMNGGVNSNFWWLRSPGRSDVRDSYTNFASRGGPDGEVGKDGAHVNHNYTGMRPALHLNLNTTYWSYAGTVTSEGGEIGIATPVPTTSSPSPTLTPLVTESPTPPVTSSPDITLAPPVTESPTPPVTSSPDTTLAPPVTESPTPSATSSPDTTLVPPVTESPTPSVTSSPDTTLTPSVTESPTPSVTSSPDITLTPPVTESPTPPVTSSPDITLAPSVTEGPSVGQNPVIVPLSVPAQDISEEAQEEDEDVTPGKVTNLKLTAKKKAIQASWKKVSGASGYELWYSTSKKFTKKKRKTTKKMKLAIKNLKQKKVYFVKVRAYTVRDGEKVYGAWSKTVKKKVE